LAACAPRDKAAGDDKAAADSKAAGSERTAGTAATVRAIRSTVMQRGESLVVAAAWVTDSSVRAGRAAASEGPEVVEV
jgi:hypothetical protein